MSEQRFAREVTTLNAVVDLEGLSNIEGGEPVDVASVSVTIKLANAEPGDLKLVLNTQVPPAQAYLRVFDESESDPFKDIRPEALEADPALAQLVNAYRAIIRTTGELRYNTIRVGLGSRELRLYYRQQLQQLEPRQWQFEFLAPYGNFQLTRGGSLSVVIALPRDPRPVLEVAEALDPSNGTPLSLQRMDGVLGDRQIVAWQWTNDPLFRVRYRYS